MAIPQKRPDLSLEQQFDHPVCGIDEVGRGPLAGPVVAACVYIPPGVDTLPFFASVNDSKKLSAKKRDELNVLIRDHCVWGIGQASVAEIDTHNILNATFIAMERAYTHMSSRRRSGSSDAQTLTFAGMTALVDGNRTPRNFPVPVQTVIKGDSISLSIAAASIIAKVERDKMMADLHTEFPLYGWADNAGYGTAAHLAALEAHGPCPHHRMSFAPCAQATRFHIKNG